MKTGRLLFLIFPYFLVVGTLEAQTVVGMGTESPNPNAVLELVSTGQNQGFLLPRLSTQQRTAVSFTSKLTENDNGLMVFDEDEGHLYYWFNNSWQKGTYSLPPNATVWYAGSTTPNNNTGTEGDFYVNQSTKAVYRKQNGQYVSYGSLTKPEPYTPGAGINILPDNTIVNTGDLDATNELQELTLTGTTLALSGSSTTIDLSPLQDGSGTDSQTLTSNKSDNEVAITIDNGNTVSFSVADDDNDSSNELQDLSLSGTTLGLSGSSTTIDLSPLQDGSGTDSQTLSTSRTADEVAITIDNGNITTFSVADGDSDSSNELQTLSSSKTANDVAITINGGNTVAFNIEDDDSDSTNELQELSFSGTTLSLSGSSTTIDLSPLQGIPGTDSQTLSASKTGNEIDVTIDGGNTITLNIEDGDSNDSNELQDLSLSGTTLALSGSPTTIDLSPLQDGTGTDSQTLSSNKSDNDVAITIDGGNTVTFSVEDGDGDSSNEIQDITLSGTTLGLSGSSTTVDLSSLQDGTGTDNQNLNNTKTADEVTISIDRGNPTTFSVADGDSDSSNELQELNLSGTTLALSGSSTTVDLSLLQDGVGTDSQTLTTSKTGNEVDIAIERGNTISFNVEDGDSDSNNEIQDLSVTGTTLALSGSSATVDLGILRDGTGTDSQTLSNTKTAEEVSITIDGGNTTTFSVADEDSDATNELQDLSITGTTLALSGSSATVDLSPLQDGTGTDNQTLSSSKTGNEIDITIDGGNTVTLNVEDDDSDSSNELQTLSNSKTGNEIALTIDRGNTTTINVEDGDSDATNELQDLNLTGTTLTLSGSSATVNLSSLQDGTGTDNQNLNSTKTAEEVTVTIDGGTSTTFSVADNDNDSNNELISSASLTGADMLRIQEGSSTHEVDLSGFQRKILPAGQVLVGNASGQAAPVGISGDISLNSDGTMTITLDAVTTAKILNQAVTTAKLADDAVTRDKINANVAGNGLVQNGNGSLDLNIAGGGLQITSDQLQLSNSGNGAILIGNGTQVNSRTVSGDVSLANSGAATVTALRGNAVAAASPSNNDVLTWNGSAWAPASSRSNLEARWFTSNINPEGGSFSGGQVGDLFYNPNSKRYWRKTGNNAGDWEEITGPAGGGSEENGKRTNGQINTGPQPAWADREVGMLWVNGNNLLMWNGSGWTTILAGD